ncbi:hypothetical protein [Cecembia sp.]|uniref:hypothetical protein n=1 Tax=Cecembia sp. TaxID=1898110 RepID=UPI0025C030C1|nr:hypothetical protein [Cecembia sp.]
MKKQLQYIISWPVFFTFAVILFVTLPACQEEGDSPLNYRRMDLADQELRPNDKIDITRLSNFNLD